MVVNRWCVRVGAPGSNGQLQQAVGQLADPLLGRPAGQSLLDFRQQRLALQRLALVGVRWPSAGRLGRRQREQGRVLAQAADHHPAGLASRPQEIRQAAEQVISWTHVILQPLQDLPSIPVALIHRKTAQVTANISFASGIRLACSLG